jgi:hypothetical protein
LNSDQFLLPQITPGVKRSIMHLNESSAFEINNESARDSPQSKAGLTNRWSKDVLMALDAIKKEEVMKAFRQKMESPSLKTKMTDLGFGMQSQVDGHVNKAY